MADPGEGEVEITGEKEGKFSLKVPPKMFPMIVGLFLILAPLWLLRPAIWTVITERNLKTAFLQIPAVKPQILSDEVTIPKIVGQTSTEKIVTFPVAFPSTPMVSVNASTESGPVKAWPINVSTTGFGLVLEKEDGFSGEIIHVKWMATEVVSQWHLRFFGAD